MGDQQRNVTRRRLLRVGAAGLLAGLAGCGSAASPGGPGTATDRDTATAAATGTSTANAYTRVYRETIDSVVLIETDAGQGTGFVFDEGHVVTNAHVVGDARTVDVRTRGGQWATGEVVGTDAHSDLAAVGVDDLPAAATPLSFVDGVTVGQEVVAIGNPFDLNGTLTTGVVSGVDRSIPGPTGYRIPDAIQTDAAVNPGNSGGPLVALDGRVVAVINSGGGDNIAFGISAALTQRVLPSLIETGSYDHPYVGVSVVDVTPTVAAANDLDEPRGLLVVSVAPDGPADGVLRPSERSTTTDGERVAVGGDVILAIDGTELLTTEDLGSYLALRARPGETVSMTILRDGDERTVDLELGTRPTRP